MRMDNRCRPIGSHLIPRMGNTKSNQAVERPPQDRRSSDEILWNACQIGRTKVAETCIDEEGADMAFLDELFGVTPLIAACHAGHIDTAKMLLDKGADIHALSRAGEYGCGKRTALHAVCGYYHASTSLKLIKMLLDRGANLALVDDDGRTPIDMARSYPPTPASLISYLEKSCAAASQEDVECFVPEKKVYQKAHVVVLPVMMEAGCNYGNYRHEMVWYLEGEDRKSGSLSLLDTTVHLEPVHQTKDSPMPSDAFNISLNSHKDSDAQHAFTVATTSNELTTQIRTLCGSFRDVAPPAPQKPTSSSKQPAVSTTTTKKKTQKIPPVGHRPPPPPPPVAAAAVKTPLKSCLKAVSQFPLERSEEPPIVPPPDAAAVVKQPPLKTNLEDPEQRVPASVFSGEPEPLPLPLPRKKLSVLRKFSRFTRGGGGGDDVPVPIPELAS